MVRRIVILLDEFADLLSEGAGRRAIVFLYRLERYEQTDELPVTYALAPYIKGLRKYFCHGKEALNLRCQTSVRYCHAKYSPQESISVVYNLGEIVFKFFQQEKLKGISVHSLLKFSSNDIEVAGQR